MLNKLKRWYHRWCLSNAIAHHKMRICSYNATTNSFIIESPKTGHKYHAYVDANGKVKFKGLTYV